MIDKRDRDEETREMDETGVEVDFDVLFVFVLLASQLLFIRLFIPKDKRRGDDEDETP